MSVKEKETSTGKGGQEGISWVESIVWGASELSEESLADTSTALLVEEPNRVLKSTKSGPK